MPSNIKLVKISAVWTPDLAVKDVILGVVVGAVQHLVAHTALEAPCVPLLAAG